MSERVQNKRISIVDKNIEWEIGRVGDDRDRAGALAVLSGAVPLAIINSGTGSWAEFAQDILQRGNYDWEKIALATAGTAVFSIFCAIAVSKHQELKQLERRRSQLDSNSLE